MDNKNEIFEGASFDKNGNLFIEKMTLEEYCIKGCYPWIETTQEEFDEIIIRCEEYTEEEKNNYGRGRNSNYRTYKSDIKKSLAELTLEEKWETLFYSDVFHDAIGEPVALFEDKLYYNHYY